MWQPEQEQSLGENGYMYICVAESLCCSPETATTLFVNPLYPNTKLKVKKKKNDSDDSTQNLKIQVSFINL